MKKTITAITVAASLTACAQAPEHISAIALPDTTFEAMSCASARAAHGTAMITLAELENAQRKAQAGDAIGVFLIGVPASSLTGGDRETEIATEKGKIAALEVRLAGC